MSSWDQRHPPTYKILKILENLKSENPKKYQPPYQRQLIGEGWDTYGAWWVEKQAEFVRS